jgi:hypothetical protein
MGKPKNKCRTHTIELMAAFEKKEHSMGIGVLVSKCTYCRGVV